MIKKYILTNESKVHRGKIVYRIKAIKDFGMVRKGDLGGFVQSEKNLSQDSTCWIFSGVSMDEAIVENNAQIHGSSTISKNSRVKDFAIIKDSDITDWAIVQNYAEVNFFSTVAGNSLVMDFSKVENTSIIKGSAVVKGRAIITSSSRVSGSSIVGANATISNFSSVDDNSYVSGFTQVEQATIKDNAQVVGKIIVKPGVTIFGDAKISGSLIISEDTDADLTQLKPIKNNTSPTKSVAKKQFSDEIKASLSRIKSNRYGNGI